jgi:hypothetical protein
MFQQGDVRLPNHLLQSSDAMFRVLQRRAINGSVMVVQVRGMMTISQNMLCSLARIDEELVKSVIFWAYDHKTYLELLETKHRWEKLSMEEGKHRSYHQFDVIFDPDATPFPSFSHPWVDHKDIMMRDRPRFFLKLLRAGYHFLFVDADIVFLRSPWPSVVERAWTLDAHLSIQTDARRWYADSRDPYELGPRVPKICAGFFFARSTLPTVRLYELLAEEVKLPDGNDQWSLDLLLNGPRMEVQLVEPLPHGLPPKRNNTQEQPGALRLRLLDQQAFTNGVLYNTPMIEDHTNMKTSFYHQLVHGNADIADRDRLPVLFHANFPAGFEKQTELKSLDLWFMDPKRPDLCLAP